MIKKIIIYKTCIVFKNKIIIGYYFECYIKCHSYNSLFIRFDSTAQTEEAIPFKTNIY